jgi:hypothetical protein
MDSGKPAWFSRYFAEFAGAELPRFYNRSPSGSAGDVKGRSSFKDGVMTIELARKLETGHKDDLNFNVPATLRIVFRGHRGGSDVKTPKRRAKLRVEPPNKGEPDEKK